MNERTWTCTCGKIYKIDGRAIRCVGPGHSVYLNPRIHTYSPTQQPKEDPTQLKLL